MKTNIHFSSYLPPFFLERKMIQTKFVEKNHNTHFTRIFINPFPESPAVREKMWNYTVKPDRSEMTIY